MRARGKRVALFVAMVATGLLVAVLLSDPVVKRTQAVIHDLPADRAADGKLRITGEKREDTLISFPGELVFDVPEGETAPGGGPPRAAYRAHIRSGKPDAATGAFLAKEPVVSLLDKETGAETGTLRADEARFELSEGVGGGVALDLGTMSTHRFSLMGSVQGDFPVGEGEPPVVLQANRIDVNGRVVTAPGLVTWTRPDMKVDGLDMSWNADTGELQFRADAHLSMEPTAQRRGLQLAAAGGLLWSLPPGAKDMRRESSGELRGPVTGRTSDGATLATDRLAVDGPAQTLTLIGPSTLSLPEGDQQLTVSSSHIRVESFDVSPRVSTDKPVTWSRPGMSGHGTGMRWEKATGRLQFDRDVQLEFEGAPGGTPKPGQVPVHWQLLSDGPLEWTVPPGAADPLREGHGEVTRNVRGGDGTALFQTELLRVDGRAGTVDLVGPSSWELHTEQESMAVRAATGIGVRAAPDGTPQHVQADGDAQAWLNRAGDEGPTHVSGASLVMDRAARELSARGQAAVEQPGNPPMTVRAADHILLRTDDKDRAQWVEAIDDVVCTSGEYEARGENLTWDIEADHAMLQGDCMLLAAGGWMSADQVEVWPRAERFRIQNSKMHVRE